jgi:hypothetical protein
MTFDGTMVKDDANAAEEAINSLLLIGSKVDM